MSTRTGRLARLVAPIAIALVALAPRHAAAQADIYGPSELSSPPKLVSAAATARLIARSYPEDLRKQNTGGNVQLEFVIGKDGKVEPSSISVVEASVPALGSAAKAVVEKMEFVPGKKDGQPVRSRVQLPIQYKP
jgi:protein TonB